MQEFSFSLLELFAFIGVVQCVYILVHVCFLAGFVRHVFLPLLYFFVLGAAFFVEFSRSHLLPLHPYYFDIIRWVLWTLVSPLSALVIIQFAHIRRLPSFKNWLILLVVPSAFGVSHLLFNYMGENCEVLLSCPEFFDFLNISGAVAGAASLLLIWGHRTLFQDVLSQKAGRERYWLILSLIILNTGLIGVLLFQPGIHNLVLLRTILGLSFVYLVSTSLLRIYPSALSVSYKRVLTDEALSEDNDVAQKIQKLLDLDKIYHEPSYSRTDLARELGVSETAVSRVINVHFGKSFPQLLNEYRVDDSKRLLLETDASIRVISQEVGFNSLPSFNRAFKDIVGQSPSSYRANIIK